MPFRKMEKFIPYIKPIPEHQRDILKRMGKIPGDEVIVHGDDICHAYKYVSILPDLETSPQKIVISDSRMTGYSVGQVLTVASSKTGRKVWKPLGQPEKGVGVATEITCSSLPGKNLVNIRWKDPIDEGNLVWKKTRILRKAKAFPANENDGIVVVESTVRDYYHDRPFVDQLPAVISAEWYYRIFTYSADDVVVSDSTCKFRPLEYSWDQMSQYIQEGLAPYIFHLDDIITLTNGSTSLSFRVVDFDAVDIYDKKHYRRSMTLVSTTPIFATKWDTPIPEYYQVIDEYVPYEGFKTYYKKSGSSYYRVAVPAGKTIRASDQIYAKNNDPEAILHGKNVWETSNLRSKLEREDSTGGMGMIRNLDSTFANLIIAVNNHDFNGTTVDRVYPMSDAEVSKYATPTMIGHLRTPVEGSSHTKYLKAGKLICNDGYPNDSRSVYAVINIG